MSWKVHKFKLLLVLFSTIAVVPISTYQRKQPNVFESSGSTEIKVTKLRYTWTIKNFSICCQKLEKIMVSPWFSDGTNDECMWNLKLYSEGSNNYNGPYLSLSITLNGCKRQVLYKFGILNAKKDETNVIKDEFEFDGNQVNPPPKRFIERGFLLVQENELIVDNKLTIFCEINATLGSYPQQFIPSYFPKGTNLKKDLGFLLDNEAFSDVILSTSRTQLKALKAILAARSPVFKSMFKLDSSNSITTIDMKDLDHRVVKEMLRYMYTDELSNVQYLAPNLLVAAEKYKLHGLKAICENALSANLTIENVTKFYILGDTYSATDLKINAKLFIASHVSDVSHTAAFKSLIKTHPHLIEEVFYALL